ncbi:hypothetical protein F5890DRAFT_1419703 [Lentinula detonsa]|uniref:Uncharacterized protein n=1 Tax=Lentinula detonsa TaxID=2804962 RepID=A0AA38PSE1_9AGAR|nr:hypothetical protein F5890DRAFT_1419703 [Lentinula detonsa]
MIGGACLDLKAIRPVAGLLDINSHHVCTSCNVFHQESILRTDHESWEPADDDYYSKGMQKWKEAETLKEREIIEHYYGTRYSPLEMLEYFKFSTMIIAEPMHAMYHRVLHLYFREALRLVTLDSIPPRYASNISFYHDFTHPPRPSNHVEALPEQHLSDDDHLLRISQLEDWLMPTMQNDIRALDDVMENIARQMGYESVVRVGHIHRFLHQPLDNEEQLEKNLERASRQALTYVCLDLNRMPGDGATDKDALIAQLIRWRSTKPTEPLLGPEIHSGDILKRIHSCIREVVVPSWLAKPPFETGLKRAGTLKADNWRTLFSLYVPLALLSLWKETSPIQSHWNDGSYFFTTTHNISKG